MLLAVTRAQPYPYVLGKANSAFYFPSDITPSEIPSQCVEWDISANNLCYCTGTILTNAQILIDPSTIFPSYYLKTFYGEWEYITAPGPYQRLLKVTFENMFNFSDRLFVSAGLDTNEVLSQDFLPWELNNLLSFYKENTSIKRWYFNGPQIAGSPKRMGVDGTMYTNNNCNFEAKGPIIGVKSYLHNTGYICGLAFAFNKCSCINQLFQLEDYSLKTMTWASGDPPISLAWTINNDLTGLTNYVNTACGDYLLSPVTTTINGYTPVSIVVDGSLISTPGNPNSITLTDPIVSGTFAVLLQITNPTGYTILGDATLYHATPLYFYIQVTTTVTTVVPTPPPGADLCTIPVGSLNLLNTLAVPTQSAFSAGYNTLASMGCNGISLSTADSEFLFTSPSIQPINYWSVFLSQTVQINTLLLIGPESPEISNLSKTAASVGSSTYFQENKKCLLEGQITDGGWYECLGSGTYIALWSTTNSITFYEIMAYSNFAIQWNSISQSWSTVLADPNYPAANVLSKFVVVNDSDVTRNKCIASLAGTATSGSFSLKFKAQHSIKAVVLVPGRNTAWTNNHQAVTVKVTDVAQNVQTCGTIADYNTYSEQICSKSGNLVTVKRSATNVQLTFCSVGILSDCKCSQTSFQQAQIYPFPNTETILSKTFVNVILPATQSITIAVNSQIPDTISSVCGNADGLSFCGDRVISFIYGATNQAINQWPFRDFVYVDGNLILNAVISQRTEIKVKVSLASDPNVSKTEVLIAQIWQAPGAEYIPTQYVFATVNQTQDYYLMQTKLPSTFNILSKQGFQTQVSDNKLTVLSTTKTDEGRTFTVKMSAVPNDPNAPSSFFDVMVKFSKPLAVPPPDTTVVPQANQKAAVPPKSQTTKSIINNSTNTTTNASNSTNQTSASNITDLSENAMICTTKENGNLEKCTSKTNIRFTCQPDETGEMVCGLDLKIKKASTDLILNHPTMVISQINNYGIFYLTFSEGMDFSRLINQLCGGLINGALSEKTDTKSARFQKLALTSDTNCSAISGIDKRGGGRSPRYQGSSITKKDGLTQDFNRNKYLLNSTHLNITLESGGDQDDSKQQFEWFILNITQTQIKLQAIFEYPAYISTDARKPDHLSVQLLQGSLPIFKSKQTRLNIEKPLRTELRQIPTQMKLDSTTTLMAGATEVLESVSIVTVIGNASLSLFLQYVMSRLYTMVNALQMTIATCRLNVAVPSNTLLVTQKVNDIASFNLLPSDKILNYFFKWSSTIMPNVGFQSMGTQSMRLTLYLGSIFIAMVLICAMSLFYGITYPCRKLDKILGRIHKKMKANYYWQGIIRLIIEAFFDLCTGIMLSINDARFNTGSDIFDFVLTCFFALVVIAAPVFTYLLLRKYDQRLDEEEFKTNYGSLTEGLQTTGHLGTSNTRIIVVWFFVRRIIIAVVIVQMDDLSPWLVITANMYLALADAIINWYYLAYASQIDGIVVSLNNFVVLILSYFPYLYAGLIPDPEARYQAGWIQASLLGGMMVANLIVCGYSTVIEIINEIRRVRIERHNLEVLKRLGYKVVLIGMAPWQIAARVCKLDWLCFDQVPRINVQIAPQVREYQQWLSMQIQMVNRYLNAQVQEVLNQEMMVIAQQARTNQVINNELEQKPVAETEKPALGQRKKIVQEPSSYQKIDQSQSQLVMDEGKRRNLAQSLFLYEEDQHSCMSFGDIEVKSEHLGNFEDDSNEHKPVERQFQNCKEFLLQSQVEVELQQIEARNKSSKKLVDDLEAQKLEKNYKQIEEWFLK